MKTRRTLGIVIAVVVVGYVAYGAYYFFAQGGMIFPAEKAKMPQGVRADYPEIHEFWPEADGVRVEAWYLPPTGTWPGLPAPDITMEAADGYANPGLKAPATPAPLLVIAHGNATVIDAWPQQLDAVRDVGWGALLVEYPGYGRSPGEPGQEIITDLFAAAYDSTVAWGVTDTTAVVALGRSLGGGVACQFATVRDTDALILVSTFTSVRAFASDYWLPGFLVLHPFDNEAVLRDYGRPVLLVHATNDTEVPYEHALKLSAASASDTLVTRHNDGHDTLQGHWDEFWRETGLAFLERVR